METDVIDMQSGSVELVLLIDETALHDSLSISRIAPYEDDGPGNWWSSILPTKASSKSPQLFSLLYLVL